ncbi:unnamed protein product [Prunus armeniaca]
MKCAPSQCTLNVYRAIICFENLSHFFKLEMIMQEFFYFSEVRHYEKDAQVRMFNAKLFDNFSQGDHVWHTDMLEVSDKWKGEVEDGPLVSLTYCDDLYDLLAKQKKSSIELLDKRKANSRSIRDEVATSQSWDASPQRKKPRPPSATSKSSSRGVSSAKKVPTRIAHFSSARIKRLVGANNKKVSGMHEVQDILLKSPIEQLKTCDLPYKEVVEKHSSSHLCRSGDQIERTVPLLNNHNSSAKPRIIKREVDSILQAAVKRARESFSRTKSPLVTQTASLRVGDSSVGDKSMSDLLKTNFMSSLSACTKLVDHVHQASDLGNRGSG